MTVVPTIFWILASLMVLWLTAGFFAGWSLRGLYDYAHWMETLDEKEE